MGVHGLWRLIEPSGKPVPLETLENKVLAVDVSIWLHQLVKGFQDAQGSPVPNAHLLGIYHRLCKLLYFRIKPVFVFDGGVPVLKKQTIAKRNQQKSKNLSEADRIHKNLLSTLLKHTAISKVLSEQAKAALATSPTKKSKDEDNLYMLPPSSQSLSSNDEEETSSTEDLSPGKQWDLHSIDTKSVQFKSLPIDVRHEILTDLKETRKQSSWGRLHELPTESDDFSIYQMRRLLNRQSVQSALEEAEKEMGGHSLSLGELEKILNDQGVITNTNLKGNRIASDENTRFLLIKDLRQAVEDAKKLNGLPTIEEDSKTDEAARQNEEEAEAVETNKNKGEQEFEDELEMAIALSLEAEPSTSKPKTVGKVKKRLSFLDSLQDADFESESSEEEVLQVKFSSAQSYMLEYSGLTPSEIAKIIASKSGKSKKGNEEKPTIEEKPIEEQAKLIVVEEETVEIMSDSESVGDDLVDVDATKEVSTTDESKRSTGDDLLDTKEESSTKASIEEQNNPKADEGDTVEIISDSESVGEDLIDVDATKKDSSSAESKRSTGDDLLDTMAGIEEQNNPKDDEADTVEIMSDSDSSGDDFLEVEGTKEESTVEAMEVVIKPNEELEDDLFKDVFADLDKPQIEDKTEERLEEPVDRPEIEKKESLKDKIEKMVKTYSRPKQSEDETEKVKLSTEQMNEMRDNLRREETELMAERSSKERLAGSITDQMCQEAQELLELFGVPYLIAPMEAEAQCAFLDLINLTDGTITDDSDIWLFGGRTVYKNFFNQSKTVLEFKSETIHHHFKLTREQMILLAMLVGSDYTTGLTGVGPVTALEILAAFPPKTQLVSGLADFRSWFFKGKLPAPGRTSLKNKLKNLSFTENFPNLQIAQAYLEPRVETSKEKFSWAKPDVVGLTDFAKRKFGWTKKKTEEILNPVLRRLEDGRKQKSIRDYFRSDLIIESGEAEKKMSKRVKTAISKIGKNGSGGGEEEEEPEPKKKRVRKKAVDGDVAVLKATKARSKKRVKEIEKEVREGVKEQEVKKTVNLASLHRKEVIPQKQKDKCDLLKNKLKAIETFRKSKQGPGFVKKQGKSSRAPKEDAAYLSDSSDSD